MAGLTIPTSIGGSARQDRERDVARKIENWPEFESELRSRGTLKAAFEPFPSYDPGLWQRLRRRLAI